MQTSMKVHNKLILIFDEDDQTSPEFPKYQACDVIQYIQQRVRDELAFLHADKHQSFLQVYFNTLGVKVSYKLILLLLIGMIKHSQSTQIDKFAISLQYLKKGKEFIFCIQINIKFLQAGILLREVVRHVQSLQNRNLVIFLQYLKNILRQLLLCSIVMQNIQIF